MTFTHAVPSNNYGPAKFIISANAANGTHTTIASALAVASSGDTIFVRTGSYTEDLTLIAGVNICAFDCDSLTPNVTITGTQTANFVGTVSISGIKFTSVSVSCITSTGTNASVLNLFNCSIIIPNGIFGIVENNVNAIFNLYNCTSNTTGTTAGAFINGATGTVNLYSCNIFNTGLSTLGSSSIVNHVNAYNCNFFRNLVATRVGDAYLLYNCLVDTSSQNLIALEASTNADTLALRAFNSIIKGGSAAAVAITNAAAVGSLYNCVVDSTNTNAISGAGTLIYSEIAFSNTSSTIQGTLTKTLRTTNIGALVVNAASYPGIATGTGTILRADGTNWVASTPTFPNTATNGTVIAGNGANFVATAAPTLTSMTFGAGTALSSYVEGTFTPGISFGGGTTGITYAFQGGFYTRIGRVVFFNANVLLSNKGSSTGDARITGFPISTGASGASFMGYIGYLANLTQASTQVIGLNFEATATTATITFSTSAGANAVVQNTAFANTTQIVATGFYFIV